MIEIKHWKFPQMVVYQSQKATNTRDALLEALEAGVSLAGADLQGVDLRGIDRSKYPKAEWTHTNLTDCLED